MDLSFPGKRKWPGTRPSRSIRKVIRQICKSTTIIVVGHRGFKILQNAKNTCMSRDLCTQMSSEWFRTALAHRRREYGSIYVVQSRNDRLYSSRTTKIGTKFRSPLPINGRAIKKKLNFDAAERARSTHYFFLYLHCSSRVYYSYS